MATQKTQQVQISAPKFQVVSFKIRGTTPYVQNKFSQKVIEDMRAKQKLGSVSSKGKKKTPKDFEQIYENSKHISEEGWCGIPAPAFRNAMISACRTVGFKMTLAKLSVFIMQDGFDKNDQSPLVKITKGEPEYKEDVVRIQMTTDIRARAMWRPGWEATVNVRFDADQFSAEDVANLMMRVGMQVGIGEGRPDSKTSAGMGWGMFEVINDDE